MINLLDQEKLLSHIKNKEAELILANVLDKVEVALTRHQPVFTKFLNPYHLRLARSILEGIVDLKFREYGGYKRAERKIVALMPDYYILDLIEEPIIALDINGQFKFQKVSHRDFLGAILGTGIKREMVGDLLLYQEGCQAIVMEDIKDYILLNLEGVHNIGVDIKEVSFEQLKIEPERIKEIRDTVASLRLDAVASSGFGSSRTKMQKDIENGRVKVNWKVIEDPAYDIAKDDLISIRGKGRVEIEELLGESRRGRIKLKLKRYI